MNESLPALLGGAPVRPSGPPDWPLPDDDVLHALQAAYHDASWGKYHGGKVEKLEQLLREYFAVTFVLPCSSGTFAVELALRALKVGPGDEVILSAYDYPGNFLSVHAVGAVPVLVDVARENWCLDPSLLPSARGPKTRAAIVSHLHGGLVPMAQVMAWAESSGVQVIEDAAQSRGLVDGRLAGAWGTIGILSFGGSKLLTAGRGGALLTRHADVHQRARLHLHRGNHIAPLSELQAAVLVPQIGKLDERNDHRAASVRRLRAGIEEVPGLHFFANAQEQDRPSFYKVGMQFDSMQFGLSRERFIAALRAEGMAFDEGFASLHVGRSPTRFRQAGSLQEAERAHHGTVILHHPILLGSHEDIDQVAVAMRKIYANAERLNA